MRGEDGKCGTVMTMRYLILGAAADGGSPAAPERHRARLVPERFLSTVDAWSCTVKADIVGQASSIRFNTESRNHVAQVNIAFQVAKGKLRVTYQDLAGTQQLLVTPSEPVKSEHADAAAPRRRSFTLFFEPVGGVVEGLTGTVKYSTPAS